MMAPLARLGLGALVGSLVVVAGVAFSGASAEVRDGEGYVTTSAMVGYSIASLLALLALLRFTDLPAGLVASIRALCLATMVLHALGLLGGLYARFEWYDTALHFAFGVGASVLGVRVLQRAPRFRPRMSTPIRLAAFALIVSTASALAWELFEYTLGFVMGTRLQPGILDTLIDALATSGGGIPGALWLATRPSAAPTREAPASVG